jgi:hypothetical protein
MLTPEKIREMDKIAGVETPTPIDDVGAVGMARANEIMEKYGQEPPSFYERNIVEPMEGFATGFAKSGIEHLQNIGKGALKIGSLGKIDTSELGIPKEYLERETPAEKLGGTVESIAEFAAPTPFGKTKALSGGVKLGTRALQSGTIASGQEGEIGQGAGLAVGTELAIPVVGKYVLPIFGKLFKGLGAGLSGTPTELIETINKNPQVARKISNEILTEGGDKVLEENAKTIINGISDVRKQAREAFGKGIQELKSQDINPQKFRGAVQEFLDNIGSSVKGNERIFENIEFDDPKNIQKASDLIDEFSKVELDGYSLRKLMEKVEKSAYKTATSDERLAFNAFIRDMSSSIKKAITDSTNKLDEINKAYSKDLQLTEAVEDIFKDVNYKNLSEVAGVARKIENLFTKKGLDPKIINDFMSRIGVDASEFRTSEAIRQIMGKTTGANTRGLNVSEITQQTTSAILDPNAVKNIAITTGLAKPVIEKIFSKVAPTMRGTLLEILTSGTND